MYIYIYVYSHGVLAGSLALLIEMCELEPSLIPNFRALGPQVCVCICIYMYTYVCICMYVYTYVCMCVFVSVCVCVYACVCIYCGLGCAGSMLYIQARSMLLIGC